MKKTKFKVMEIMILTKNKKMRMMKEMMKKEKDGMMKKI
jgi:hypothetical protein